MIKFPKSPLRYPGGKSRALKQILPLIPANIEEYREPFVGGGSVFFAVRSLFGSRIRSYWINDLNYDLYCFWKQTRDNGEALADALEEKRAAAKDGRALFAELSQMRDALSRDQSMLGEFDRAARYFILNRITFSGVVDSGGYSQYAFERRFTASSIERVRKISRWLQGAVITHADYAEAVCAEGEGTFLFLDPPYWKATASKLYGARGALHTGFDHARFAETMRRSSHRWLITYDDSAVVRGLFGFAEIQEWTLQYGMNNYRQDGAAKGAELFIKNY